MIEEPVVENPEVDSKNASTNEGMVPLKRYGSVPSREKTTHEIVTDINPSRLVNFAGSALRDIK